MRFEEVLPLMRKGKKARHLRMKNGEYWTCGFQGFEDNDKWPTLIKMFENPFESELYPDSSSWSWGI